MQNLNKIINFSLATRNASNSNNIEKSTILNKIKKRKNPVKFFHKLHLQFYRDLSLSLILLQLISIHCDSPKGDHSQRQFCIHHTSCHIHTNKSFSLNKLFKKGMAKFWRIFEILKLINFVKFQLKINFRVSKPPSKSSSFSSQERAKRDKKHQKPNVHTLRDRVCCLTRTLFLLIFISQSRNMYEYIWKKECSHEPRARESERIKKIRQKKGKEKTGCWCVGRRKCA